MEPPIWCLDLPDKVQGVTPDHGHEQDLPNHSEHREGRTQEEQEFAAREKMIYCENWSPIKSKVSVVISRI